MRGLLPHRKATWALLLFNIIMLIWVISGVASTSGNATNCGTLTQDECNAAKNVGVGLGITALIIVWFLGFVVLGIIALLSRPHRRLCPACGTEAKRGVTVCTRCGHNFATGVSMGGSVPPAPPAPTT